MRVLLTKHFLLFIKKDMHQYLDGDILEILKKEIRHETARPNRLWWFLEG
jgi:hypothetical protein